MATISAIVLVLLGFTVNGQVSTHATTLSEASVVRRYFEQAMIYPESALKKGIRGKVTVSLDVMPDGETRNYKIERGTDPMIEAEALRLAMHLLWKPAIVAGNPVPTRETITIDFNPKTYLRKKKDNKNYSEYATLNASAPEPIYNLRQLSESPQPILPVGFKSVNSYIIHLMKYPEMAARNSISGTVVLDFVIEKSGIASNIRIRQSVGGGCDQEAIRILEQLRWLPAKKAGEPARTHADLEISFRLTEHQQRSIPNQRSTGL